MPSVHPVQLPPEPRSARGYPIQMACAAAGFALILMGAFELGRDVVADSGQRVIAVRQSGAILMFVLNDLVHVAFGAAGLALAHSFDGSRRYLIGGGIVLSLMVAGLAIGRDGSDAHLTVTDADEWFHLGLAVAMIASGIVLGWTPHRSGEPVGSKKRITSFIR